MSEDREAQVQKELLNEVQTRRQAEKRNTEQADRIAELEDRLQVQH
jgi:hypothetical protein